MAFEESSTNTTDFVASWASLGAELAVLVRRGSSHDHGCGSGESEHETGKLHNCGWKSLVLIFDEKRWFAMIVRLEVWTGRRLPLYS